MNYGMERNMPNYPPFECYLQILSVFRPFTITLKTSSAWENVRCSEVMVCYEDVCN